MPPPAAYSASFSAAQEPRAADKAYCQNQEPDPDTSTAVTPHASKSLPAGIADHRISSIRAEIAAVVDAAPRLRKQ
jgi:hypothetical protein